MKQVTAWLQGKKTYIVAGVLMALGLFACLDTNPGNDYIGLGFVAVGLGMFGLHAQADRQHAEMLVHVAKAIQATVQRRPLTAEEKTGLLEAGMHVAGDIQEAMAPVASGQGSGVSGQGSVAGKTLQRRGTEDAEGTEGKPL